MPSTERSDAEPAAQTGRVPRFSRAERAVHRLTAVLMSVCIGTAAILYNGSLAIEVGHRHAVELLHVYCGFALPVPLAFGLGSLAYRADVRRLGRFVRADWHWLRSRTRRDGRIEVGKFNAGQKLNASLTFGSILVLFGTGVIMYFVWLAPLSWRSGATFVHDWFALGLGLLVAGHLYFALKDPNARHGMRTGWVSRHWAGNEHARWLAELDQATDSRPLDGTGRDVERDASHDSDGP